MHAKLAEMAAKLAEEQHRRRAAEDSLARERAEWAATRRESDAERAAAKKAAAKSHADYMRMRAERDNFEWLLRRVHASTIQAPAAAAATRTPVLDMRQRV